jgi:uncharacterized repeat protein (TIGR01451 family)
MSDLIHLRNLSLFVYASLLFASAAPSRAADDVVVNLKAQKVLRDASGKEKLVSAEQAKPGDIIVYEAIYRNTAKAAVSNLQATLPIPTGLELLPETSKPAGVQASTDSVTFGPLPLMRTVKTADGKSEKVEVPNSEIRALRWAVPKLGAGETFSVSARARVVTTAPPTK